MKRNLGNLDRMLRVVVSIGMLICAALAPLPIVWRLSIFGGLAAYILLTALAGTCLGYRMMGRTTCPAKES
jgi:Protein of unknown function (DUF2892)